MTAHQVMSVGVSSLTVPRFERGACVGTWTPILEAAADRVIGRYKQDVVGPPHLSAIVAPSIALASRILETQTTPEPVLHSRLRSELGCGLLDALRAEIVRCG